MIKTFWAVEIQVLQITADVNEHNFTIADGQQTTRNACRSHYDGSFSEEAALKLFDALDETMKKAPRR